MKPCGDSVSYRITDQVLRIFGSGPMWDFDPEEPPEVQRTVDYDTPWRDAGVRKVIVEEGVTRVGNGAFCRLADLCEVTLPESLCQIGGRAFAGSGLTAVHLPDRAAEIGTHAFFDCEALLTVSLPNGARLGSYAFARTGLQSLTFRGRLDRAEKMAFWNCGQLRGLRLPPTGVLGTGVFADCGLRFADLSASGLEALPDYLFMNCREMEQITLPPQLREIHGSAFFYTGLRMLVLPETVERFGPDAVARSNSLERIIFLGRTAPRCRKHALFRKTDILMTIREDALGFGAQPWSLCPVERVSEDRMRHLLLIGSMQDGKPILCDAALKTVETAGMEKTHHGFESE